MIKTCCLYLFKHKLNALNVKGISVVIPNYNGRALLEQIIPPLMAAVSEVNLPYEIIIADDCSTDDSVAYLRLHFPAVTILKSDRNWGFSASANKGIFAAVHSHLLILNSDVKLEKNYFSPLLSYFDRPDTFGVMSRIVGWNDDTIQDGGKYPFFHGAKIKTSGNYLPLDPGPNEWLYSIYLSGANAFIDREKILELKGFDELFSPYYIEDYELSLRAWRLGWKCYYEHSSVCRHRTSSTIRSTKNKNAVAVIYNRNKMFLHAIHLQGSTKLMWYLQLLLETLLKMVTVKWYYVKAVLSFFQSGKKVSQSRDRFNELLAKRGTGKTVNEVVNEIITSLATTTIKRF